jgi:hypothetical protein
MEGKQEKGVVMVVRVPRKNSCAIADCQPKSSPHPTCMHLSAPYTFQLFSVAVSYLPCYK